MSITKGLTVVVISDMHCGSRQGLVPPSYFLPPSTDPAVKAASQARDWYIARTKEFANPDILIHNGDAIEGKQTKMEGRELFTTDRLEQANMAAECLELWGAKKIIMTRGTGYHTGYGEHFEDAAAAMIGAEIYNSYMGEFEGVVLRCRHKIGRSSNPHGVYTPIAKNKLWADLDTLYKDYPFTNVLIGSHVHYYAAITRPNWMAMSTPALQLPGGEFGEQQCMGYYDYGITVFKFYDGDWEWKPVLMELKTMVPKIDKINVGDL